MFNTFEHKIMLCLEKVQTTHIEKNIHSDAEWTNAINSELTQLAYETFNFKVWVKPNDTDHTTNEWLYDLVMFDSADSKGLEITKIHLAMESEWHPAFDEIRYDFNKLLQARAEHRCFIFQSKQVKQTLDALKNIVMYSSIAEKGDRYMFAGWNDDDGFTFDLYIKP